MQHTLCAGASRYLAGHLQNAIHAEYFLMLCLMPQLMPFTECEVSITLSRFF